MYTIYHRSLQNVIEQLVANTAELGRLQSKVDSGHMTSKEEMVMLLEAKDRQMKMVQEQLQKQREESEQERSTLKEHILRLEGKLHQQTIEVEEVGDYLLMTTLLNDSKKNRFTTVDRGFSLLMHP